MELRIIPTGQKAVRGNATTDHHGIRSLAANAPDVDDFDDGSEPAAIEKFALQWMARIPRPQLLIAPNLTVLWMNARARSELALRQGIELRDNMLTTTSPSHQETLLGLFHASPDEESTVCIREPDGTGHVLIHAHRLDLQGKDPHFGLRFHRVGQKFKPAYVGLDRAFGLTAGEQRVLSRLVEGGTLPAIAELLDLSLETIRTHVRNIYAKMQVSSRAEMFSMVRAFRL